jgi:hypothetical protein
MNTRRDSAARHDRPEARVDGRPARRAGIALLAAALLVALLGRAAAQDRRERAAPPLALKPTGSELFRGLFDFYHIEPITPNEFQDADLKSVIVVVLGLPGRDGNAAAFTARVLEAGGAVLIAADRGASLANYFPGRPNIAVTGESVGVPPGKGFAGRPDCPFVVPLQPSIVDTTKWQFKNKAIPTPEWLLFVGLDRLATNEPSALRVQTADSKYVWSRLAGFPPNSRASGVRPHDLLPPGREERVFAAGGAGVGAETYRSLVLADPSVFTNQMLAPDPARGPSENFEFARRVVQWLRGPGERSQCLFVEAGGVQTRFDEVKYSKYQTPRVPPMPMPPLPSPFDPKLQRGLNDFADRQLAELEDRDIPNRALGEDPDQFRKAVRGLAVAAGVLALVYLLRRVWAARHEPDLPPPPGESSDTPPASIARRREELLQLGDYTAVVRDYLRELFAAQGLPPRPSPAPRKHPPATVSGPDAGILRHHLRILWNVAHGRDGRAIDYARWKELEPMIDALRRAADENRWRFVDPGETA